MQKNILHFWTNFKILFYAASVKNFLYYDLGVQKVSAR